MKKRLLALALLLALLLSACGAPARAPAGGADPSPAPSPVQETSLPSQTPAETPTPDGDALPSPAETPAPAAETSAPEPSEVPLPEDGSYDSKEEVALYLHLYGHLPPNFIAKREAEALGWTGGSLEPYAPGRSIGGSRFGNYEGLLPEAEGRTYTECDIDTAGKKSRGAKRIVFSNDGLIYYTDDHYESFTLLYGEE